jgi:hypothetical protein
MRRTDHDLCIFVLKKFVEDNPKRYRLIEFHTSGEPGPNFLAKDFEENIIIYAEVELDAKQTDKAKRIAKRARQYTSQYGRPVLLAMVASSEKWVSTKDRTGVKDFLEDLVRQGKVQVIRVSPLAIGAYASSFVSKHRPLRLSLTK